jgi:hypothetical protein
MFVLVWFTHFIGETLAAIILKVECLCSQPRIAI